MKKIQNVLATIALAGAAALQGTYVQAQGKSHSDLKSLEAIRPFHVHISDADVNDLRQRLHATRWPEKETVANQSQGAQLESMKKLIRYWGTEYDWRKAEAKLNAWPQFLTTIDGLDIHFIHVRSRHPNALPLLVAHG